MTEHLITLLYLFHFYNNIDLLFSSNDKFLFIKEEIEKLNINIKIYLFPIRVAITGESISLPLFESIEILGIEETRKRIKNAILSLINN